MNTNTAPKPRTTAVALSNRNALEILDHQLVQQLAFLWNMANHALDRYRATPTGDAWHEYQAGSAWGMYLAYRASARDLATIIAANRVRRAK